jgi:hypothetical protein
VLAASHSGGVQRGHVRGELRRVGHGRSAATLLAAADDADHHTLAGGHVEVGAWQAIHRHFALGGLDLTEFITRLNTDLLSGRSSRDIRRLCRGLPDVLIDRRQRQRDPAALERPRRDHAARIAGPAGDVVGAQAADGLELPLASSVSSDFNIDLGFSSSREQTREWAAPMLDRLPPIALRNAKETGTDIVGYLTESFGFSVFVLDGRAVYQTYSSGSRAADVEVLGAEVLAEQSGAMVRPSWVAHQLASSVA